ncbi:hypothetical protein ACJIZ3_009233 [Penstemon smallii]|uniref:Uncharacterized protein n=1 Tax=Penstemon smallii TaxID=265156 RepID=A0ABD3TBX9_9LAMI
MAARAHDVAAIALRAWRLPIPASLDVKDIKKAAVEAAEAFRMRALESGEGTATSYVEYLENVITTIEAGVESPENALFMYDEEEALMFGMHGLLGNMAEGLMLPPPHQFSYDVEMDADMCLWSFN